MKKIKVLFVLIPAAVALGCDAGSHIPTSPATGLNAPDAAERVVAASAGASGTTVLSSGPEAYSTGTGPSHLVEIEGRVDSVTPPDLVVMDRRGPRTIRTSIATRIEKDDRRISLSEVLPGDQVEVEGVLLSDGSLLAREIEVEGEDHDENEVEFTGTIESIDSNVLVISGRTVIVTPSTVIKKDGQRIGVEQLVLGDRVEVEGVRLADETILASELEVRDADDEDVDDDDDDDEDDEQDDEDDEDDDNDD